MDSNTTLTLDHILTRYESECLHELASRTQVDYRRHISHLRRRFGDLDARSLEPQIFAQFLTERRKGRIQRVRQLAVLSAALTIAVRRWFWLKTNVLRDVERPRSKPRDRLIRDEEFLSCQAIAPHKVRLAMQLALLTGQRQGDIIRLRWRDVRESFLEEPGCPSLKRRVTEIHVFQSKTGKRIAIEVTSDVESILDQCWQLKGGGHAGSAYILPTRTGKPYTSEGFRACWQRTINKYCALGGERFHFHDIRALAATKCRTLEEAQQLLGHTSSAMTRRVYRRGIERVQPLALTAISTVQEVT